MYEALSTCKWKLYTAILRHYKQIPESSEVHVI